MKNEFADKIKNIEEELLNLKTATEYSTARSASHTSTEALATGLYNVVFENTGEPIISLFFQAAMGRYSWIYPRTPKGNTQVLEVNTTHWNNQTQQYETDSCPITVISNVPVVSITTIS